MKAIEFKSKILNNTIQVPQNLQEKIEAQKEKDVRVILLMDEPSINEEELFKTTAAKKFFEGYSETDEIYDSL